MVVEYNNKVFRAEKISYVGEILIEESKEFQNDFSISRQFNCSFEAIVDSHKILIKFEPIQYELFSLQVYMSLKKEVDTFHPIENNHASYYLSINNFAETDSLKSEFYNNYDKKKAELLEKANDVRQQFIDAMQLY